MLRNMFLFTGSTVRFAVALIYVWCMVAVNTVYVLIVCMMELGSEKQYSIDVQSAS